MFSWIINKRNKLRRGLRLKEKSVDFTKRRGGAKNTLYAKIKYSLEKCSETEQNSTKNVLRYKINVLNNKKNSNK